MSWTQNVQSFFRSLSPYPHTGTIRLGFPLPGTATPRPWQQGEFLDLGDYRASNVNESFRDFDGCLSGWDLQRMLSQDYYDEKGQRRVMTQLEGRRSSYWEDTRGVHLTYRSDTLGDRRPNNHYGFFLGHEGWEQFQALGRRNLAGVAMAKSQWADKPVTASVDFAMVQDTLCQRLNVADGNLFAASAALYERAYAEPPFNVETWKNGAVAYGSSGKVHVAPLGLRPQNDMLLAIINNVRQRDGWWGREYYQDGIVNPNPFIDNLLREQGVEQGGEILDKIASRVAVPDVYARANQLVADATGVGA